MSDESKLDYYECADLARQLPDSAVAELARERGLTVLTGEQVGRLRDALRYGRRWTDAVAQEIGGQPQRERDKIDAAIRALEGKP